MDIGAALTIALLAALLGQAWAAQVRLERQLGWLSAALLLNAMTLPAAMLLFGDSREALGLVAGFCAVLAASASGMGALIWLYRIEKLSHGRACGTGCAQPDAVDTPQTAPSGMSDDASDSLGARTKPTSLVKTHG